LVLEFRPVKSNNKANSLTIILFLGAVILLVLNGFLQGLPFRWVLQLFPILFLTASVFLVARYVVRYYLYRIELSEGSADLTVTELSGKRQITVCRISVGGIKECMLIDMADGGKEKLREMKKQKGKKFDYRVDLAPEKSILILTDEGYDTSMILLSYHEDLWEELRRGTER